MINFIKALAFTGDVMLLLYYISIMKKFNGSAKIGAIFISILLGLSAFSLWFS